MDVLSKNPSAIDEEEKVEFGGHDLKISKEDQLESTRAEMNEVKQENERLKTVLAHVLKDYQSLQMQFHGIIRQESSSNKINPINPSTIASHPIVNEETNLVSLTLGSTSMETTPDKLQSKETKKEIDDGNIGGGLTLGLDCKFEGSSSASTQPASNASMENSLDDHEQKKEKGGEESPHKTMLKIARSTMEDEVSQHIQVKKARVSVRTRCDAPTMNDGCQWRKYGQKISKGNPCPRAYYRCTVAPSCPVRKQVQRCAEDMSILITTYEGAHNHPLPMAATAMASTTSAAASMLLSGSSSSSRPNILPSPFNAPTFQGLNFSIADASKPKPYFLSPSIANTPIHPTITLDLTAPSPSANVPNAIPSTQFNRCSLPFASSTPRSSTSLSFSSFDTNSTQSPWNQLYNNRNLQVGDSLYHSSYLPKNPIIADASTQQALTDTLAKAITSDPSFKSALAAAITSIVGGEQGTQGVGGHLAGMSPLLSSSNFVNRTAQNQGASMFLQPSLSLSNLMNSTGNVEKRDNTNS